MKMGIAPYGSEYETEDDRREHNRPIPYYAFNEDGEQVHDYDYGDDDDEPTESAQWPDDVDEPPTKTLDAALEKWQVHEPYMWENTEGPKGWYAVSDDTGIVAYFVNSVSAFRWRLDMINRDLNP